MEYLNLEQPIDNVTLTLMKNSRESICQIPIDNVSNQVEHSLTMDKIDNFTLKVYKYIIVDGQKVLNRVYKYMKPRQQIISQIAYKEKDKVTHSSKVKVRRWIINEKPKIYNSNNDKIYKEVKVEEFQSNLKGKRVNFNQDDVLQLYNKEKEDNSDGILDRFEYETGWKINNIDEKARYETIKTIDTVETVLQKDFVKNGVQKGELLFEYNFKTKVTNGQPLYIQFEYEGIVVSNNVGATMESINVTNTFGEEPINDNIVKIQAYHCSEINYRYGIKYVLTLKNGSKVERVANFCNCVENNIKIDKIKFMYETGIEIEKTQKQFININSAVDTSWYDYLNSIQDTFNCIFTFDSYNKTMDVIARENLNVLAPWNINFESGMLSYETNVENTSFPNGLKVVSSQQDVDIIADNYFGDDTIYDYTYYVQNELMSKELINKWKRYENLLIIAQEQWSALEDVKSISTQKKLRVDNEITTLNSQIDALNRILTTYQSKGDSKNQARVKKEIDEINSRLNECLKLSSKFKESIDNYSNKMDILSTSIKRENAIDSEGKIFDSDDISELYDVTYIEELSDDYFTDSYSLYKYSIEYLKNKLQPYVSINVKMKNLCQLFERDWKKVMVLGYKYTFNDIDNELMKDLGTNQLIFKSFKFDIKDKRVTDVEFVNKIQNSKDIKKTKLNTIRKKVSKVDRTITDYGTISNKANSSSNFIRGIKANGMNLSDVKLLSKTESNINVLNDNGYIVKDSNDENKAIALTGGRLYMTENGWESSKVAITNEKLVAEVIMGQLLLGNKLCISQVDKNNKSTGQFYIGNFDDTHKQNDNGKVFGIQLNDKDKAERIFIGLEYDEINNIQKPMFIIKGKDGKRKFQADEDILYISGDFELYDKNTNNLSIQVTNNQVKIYDFINGSNKILGRFGGVQSYKEGVRESGIGIIGENNIPIMIVSKDNDGNLIGHMKIVNNKNILKNINIVDDINFCDDWDGSNSYGKATKTTDNDLFIGSKEDNKLSFGYVDNNGHLNSLFDIGKGIDGNFSARFNCSMEVKEDFSTLGNKNRLVLIDSENKKYVRMNAIESANKLFVDEGFGVIGDDGTVTITIDNTFNKTINTTTT